MAFDLPRNRLQRLDSARKREIDSAAERRDLMRRSQQRQAERTRVRLTDVSRPVSLRGRAEAALPPLTEQFFTKEDLDLLNTASNEQLAEVARTGNLAALGGDIGSPSQEPSLPGVAGVLGTPAEAASTLGTLGAGGIIKPALATGATRFLATGDPEEAAKTAAITAGAGAALNVAGKAAAPVIRRGAENLAERVRGQGGIRGTLAEEVGGTKVPGLGDEAVEEGFIRGGEPNLPESPTPATPPIKSLEEKLVKVSKLDKRELTPLVNAERRVENIERTKAYQTTLRELLDEGVPMDEAITQARGRLAGKHFDLMREGFDITPEETAAFNERLLSIPPNKTYTMDNVYTAVWEGASGRRLRNWEIKQISEVFGKDFADAVGLISQKASRQTFDPLAFLSDLLTAPITFKSSLDGSYPLRQGWKMAPRHPGYWLESIGKMGTMAKSETGFTRLDDMITGDDFLVPVSATGKDPEFIPLGQLITDGKFDIRRVLPDSPEAADRALLDERVMSRAANAVPGVRQSVRAFVGGGNWLRHGAGRKWIQNAMARNLRLTGTAHVTPLELEELASVVKRGSGLGEIGAKTSWLRELIRHVMWAPGLRSSGPQLLWRVVDPRGVVLPKTLPVLGEGTPMIARRAAAEMGATWFAAGTTAMGLAAAAGFNVVTDANHTNFGTISIPGTRTKYNIWGSDQNLARAAARMIEGEGVDEFGNTRPIPPQKAIGEWALSGLNPALADIKAIYEGRTYDKELTGWNKESALRFAENELPIFLQDVKRMYELDGFLQAAGSTPYTFFGGSSQIYSETGGKFRSIPKFNTDLETTRQVFPDAQEPLNLDANEERKVQDILVDTRDWIDEKEQQFGPKPDLPYETFITAYGREKKIEPRLIAAAIFLNKAKSHPEWLNPEWLQYALENEGELSERYPDQFNAAYIDEARQTAQQRGLIR